MKRVLFFGLFLAVLPLSGWSSTPDQVRLQAGFWTFVQYCQGCHSTRYQRYGQVAGDLDIAPERLPARPGDRMLSSLDGQDARAWFGLQPPDLTLIARVRGTDWLQDFLQGFYADPARPFGVNNRLLPGLAMPHVLAPLQAQLSAADYAARVRDLVDFLAYSAAPFRQESRQLGAGVLLFLGIFTVFAWLLKREYWKDPPAGPH